VGAGVSPTRKFRVRKSENRTIVWVGPGSSRVQKTQGETEYRNFNRRLEGKRGG